MANRQYGQPTGYQEDYQPYRSQMPQQMNTNNPPPQPRQYPEYPAPSQTSPQRSPPRKPVNPYASNPNLPNTYAAPPPPPPHQNQALRDIDNLYGGRRNTPSPEGDPWDTSYETQYRPKHNSGYSQNSQAPLSAYAQGMPSNNSPPRGMPAPGMLAYGYGYDSSMPSSRSFRSDGYEGYVDPHDIADDDDGFEDQPASRGSRFGMGAGAAAGAGGSAVPSMLKGFGGSRDTSGNYGQVPGGGNVHRDAEKSEWLKQNGGVPNKKLKYIFGGLGVLIVLGIIAGVVGGILATNPGSGGSGSSSAANVPDGSGNKYNINSPEVKDLLNNKNLHKVFPAMDYTPLNAQYPDCLTNPPTQDNVTLDVAMLSQLTPSIRLYGTDCDQTELVLGAIDKLEMNDTLKVWLGVWLGDNSTTNNRQLNTMYDIIDNYPSDHFAGIIIGNEVLFREDLTETELASELQKARAKLSEKGIDLPVSTSDLGDNWTAELAADSDIVMANVHPFFAGVKPDAAPGWTWSFWSTHDENLAASTGGKWPKSIISETGWPSEGGSDCGTGSPCPDPKDGAVAGIDELNEFMEGWVCPSLANGTTYFWFEAFDEPWKEIFNTKQMAWETHWGLMDINRNLKDGVKIPDCGGKTIDKPY